MRHEFQPEDLDEYEQAARYFEDRRPGLCDLFIQNVEHAIAG